MAGVSRSHYPQGQAVSNAGPYALDPPLPLGRAYCNARSPSSAIRARYSSTERRTS
jgi:hypothetical protein